MPERSGRMPQPAQVEDCLSDDSSVKPGTARQARQRTLSVKPPKVVQRRADSDSGYSSHTNASAPGQSPATAPTTTRYTTTGSPTKSRPIIHRSESRSARPPAPSRSASVSRQCTDTACSHASCLSKRNTDRRYTLQPGLDPAQYAAAMAQYQQQAQQTQQAQAQQAQAQAQAQAHQAYQAQQALLAQQSRESQQAQLSARQYRYPPQYGQSPATQAVPIVTPQPRPRATSTSRPRPASMYGNVSYTGLPPTHGPPPSPSAYQNQFPAYYQQYPPAIYGSTPPNQTMPNYPPQSPIVPSPTSGSYAVGPALTRTYSTREVTNPALVNYGVPKAPVAPPLSRTISARQNTSMPGTFPGPESDQSDSESASESDTDSEAEREREHEAREKERRARARDRQAMPPPARRPSLKERKTTPAAPLRSSTREPLRRAPRSDTAVDYPSSSDNVDSDRTARAVVERSRARTESSYSGRSRRPSVSTTASSGRTKATTVSSGSGSATHKYIIEDRNGRRKEYLSKEQYNELIRRYEVQKLEDKEMEERVQAYQNQVRGQQPPELTAENIQKAARRTSGSHVSGHSRKSSTHSSSKNTKSDGIRIQSGDTVLHVYGEARVEMKTGEDGTPAFIIGSTSGKDRDSAYHGSKSSGSRISRRKDTITEEDDGYERAL